MADQVTKISNLVDPEVMGDAVDAKVEQMIKINPYAKLDTTLEGVAGSTISIPTFKYIGDAVEVGEGDDIPVRLLECGTEEYTIKMIGIGTTITDKAILCGVGNPVGQATGQMAKSIANKCDWDGIEELYKASTTKVVDAPIGYKPVVLGVGAFKEEENTEKVVFIHPDQETELRLDPDFISKDKYGDNVMVTGEIGRVANASVKVSKKVKVDGGYYFNPIVKLETEVETEDEAPALTIFLKRDTNIETQRLSRGRKTEITGDKLYTVALTNDEKVVILKTKQTPEI